MKLIANEVNRIWTSSKKDLHFDVYFEGSKFKARVNLHKNWDKVSVLYKYLYVDKFVMFVLNIKSNKVVLK